MGTDSRVPRFVSEGSGAVRSIEEEEVMGKYPSWLTDTMQSEQVMMTGSMTNRLKVDVGVRFSEMHSTGVRTHDDELDSEEHVLKMTTAPSVVFSKRYPCLQNFVMNPTSFKILIWLVIGPLLIAYDIIMIPMQSFPLPEHDMLDAMSIATTAYWTLDVVRGFFTGYETDKGVEMRPNFIARKYFRSWFGLDAATCTVDWLLLLRGNAGTFNKFWRTSRAMQAWRVLRMVRLVRIFSFLQRATSSACDHITSLERLIVFKSVYIGLGVALSCHYMACYWYAVGSQQIPVHVGESRWLVVYQLESLGVDEFFEIYVCCFYWAIGQAGFSRSDIYPQNSVERLYACGVSFAWLIIISVTINFFSIWMSQLQETYKDEETQSLYLRKFLEEHEVSKRLTLKVLRCFRAHYSEHKRRVHEEDIDFMRDLPVSLKLNLRREVFMPVLKQHPFFTFIGKVIPSLPIMITYCAMREDRYLAGEVVFAENEPGSQMIYIVTGRLDYYAVNSCMFSVTKLKAGQWACEPALWLRWVCRGRLVTESTSELVSVDTERFMAIMHYAKARGEDLSVIKRFARKVCNAFRSTTDRNSTDLWGDYNDEIEEIASEALGMSSEATK